MRLFEGAGGSCVSDSGGVGCWLSVEGDVG